jgi:hypothetical protein
MALDGCPVSVQREDVPDANLTDTELLILRHSPTDYRGSCTVNCYDDIKIDLARRGLLIAKRNSWGPTVYLTPAGINAVWDRAHADIRHLRPGADELERVAAANAEALEVWRRHGCDIIETLEEAA